MWAEFARVMPGWCRDGVPLSWRHFVYGLAHIYREQARASLRMASASGIVYAAKNAAKDWHERHRALAGW